MNKLFSGQFNYFSLFELGSFDENLLAQLGKPFKILEVAHKPFPAGRATQTVLTILHQWQTQNAFEVSDIERIDVSVPPLIMLLVGRPLEPDRPRCTNDAGAPRKELWAEDGVKVRSLNECISESHWPKEIKPNALAVMLAIRVLKEAADILGLSVFIITDDYKSFFNQMRLSKSEYPMQDWSDASPSQRRGAVILCIRLCARFWPQNGE